MRELGIKAQPRALLAAAGVALSEMKDCEQCCGFGGTFAVKYGDISGAIVDEKCSHIRATGADAVVLGDLGCILNIEGRLQRLGDDKTRVLHVAQVLAGDVGWSQCKCSRWTLSRDFPAPVGKTFRELYRDQRSRS